MPVNTLGTLGAGAGPTIGNIGVRGSWYSQAPEYGWVDRGDKPNSNALGVPDARQGIALPSRKTLGQWFDLTAPNGGVYRVQQTDVGPAPWTGRGVDVSAAQAHRMGYTPQTFPTDARFTVAPADGAGAGWQANVGPASAGVGYVNAASVPQGATTDPAELVRQDGGGFSPARPIPQAQPFAFQRPVFGMQPLGKQR